MTGVEICVQAEDYLAGGEIDMALDRFIQINIKYLHSTQGHDTGCLSCYLNYLTQCKVKLIQLNIS